MFFNATSDSYITKVFGTEPKSRSSQGMFIKTLEPHQGNYTSGQGEQLEEIFNILQRISYLIIRMVWNHHTLFHKLSVQELKIYLR